MGPEYNDFEGVNKYFMVLLKCIVHNQKHEETTAKVVCHVLFTSTYHTGAHSTLQRSKKRMICVTHLSPQLLAHFELWQS